MSWKIPIIHHVWIREGRGVEGSLADYNRPPREILQACT